jgi:hypothetical protein
MWCMRDCATGLTRRRGWLAPLAQPPCAAFLAPLQPLEWPMLAVLSDPPTGLVPAIAPVVPNRRHPCCPAHDVRHLAEPLAAADAACTGARRHTGRAQVGAVLRQAPRRPPGHARVLTVPGLVPRPVEAPTVPPCPRPAPAAAPRASAPEAATVIPQRLCHTRSLLTLKGWPPLRLAGMDTYERLHRVACVSRAWLAQRDARRRAPVDQRLQAAFSPLAATSHAFHQGAAWLRDLASI